MLGNTIRILFICSEHGERSKIAAFYTQKYGSSDIDAYSACFDAGKSGRLLYDVMEDEYMRFMSEPTRSVFDFAALNGPFDVIVTMCSTTRDLYEMFDASLSGLFDQQSKIIAWDISPFSNINDQEYNYLTQSRNIRFQIKNDVLSLLEKIKQNEIIHANLHANTSVSITN